MNRFLGMVVFAFVGSVGWTKAMGAGCACAKAEDEVPDRI